MYSSAESTIKLTELILLGLCSIQCFTNANTTKIPQNRLEIEEFRVDSHVTDGGVASVFCRVDSRHASAEVVWRRAGKRVTSNKNRHDIVSFPDASSLLRIDPVKARKDNNVTFECAVTDDGTGETHTASGALSVYSTPEIPEGFPAVIQNPGLKAVREGDDAVMICLVTGAPSPDVRWLKDYAPVNVTDTRITVLQAGSLQIQSVEESDEGKYQCVAENHLGVAYSSMAQLFVRTSLRRIPPSFWLLPDNPLEALPGSDVNLTCVAVGFPKPRVIWRLGELALTTEDETPVGRNYLQLTNVKVSGNYTCVATSDSGTISATIEVKIQGGQSPPRFSVPPPPHVDVLRGGAVNLTCVAEGEPVPHVRWLYGIPSPGRPMETADLIWTGTGFPGQSALPLRNIQTDVNMTCVAGSALGTIHTVSEIRVMDNVKRDSMLEKLEPTLASTKRHSEPTQSATSSPKDLKEKIHDYLQDGWIFAVILGGVLIIVVVCVVVIFKRTSRALAKVSGASAAKSSQEDVFASTTPFTSLSRKRPKEQKSSNAAFDYEEIRVQKVVDDSSTDPVHSVVVSGFLAESEFNLAQIGVSRGGGGGEEGEREDDEDGEEDEEEVEQVKEMESFKGGRRVEKDEPQKPQEREQQKQNGKPMGNSVYGATCLLTK